ncbi:unnamed protein product [Amoebophrya sp. A25]|nr:unnamed protein product [Amoebophrya sp. A25]|eukprot:GSA25T00005434001.1
MPQSRNMAFPVPTGGVVTTPGRTMVPFAPAPRKRDVWEMDFLPAPHQVVEQPPSPAFKKLKVSTPLDQYNYPRYGYSASKGPSKDNFPGSTTSSFDSADESGSVQREINGASPPGSNNVHGFSTSSSIFRQGATNAMRHDHVGNGASGSSAGSSFLTPKRLAQTGLQDSKSASGGAGGNALFPSNSPAEASQNLAALPASPPDMEVTNSAADASYGRPRMLTGYQPARSLVPPPPPTHLGYEPPSSQESDMMLVDQSYPAGARMATPSRPVEQEQRERLRQQYLSELQKYRYQMATHTHGLQFYRCG